MSIFKTDVSIRAVLLLTCIYLAVGPTVAGPCPSGFGYYYSHGTPLNSWRYSASCYKFVTDFETWMDAWKKCRALGAYLVSIETVGEQNHLQAVLRAHSNLQRSVINGWSYRGYWTSGLDEEKEGTWKWAATGSSINYKNWNRGEPNDSGSREDCLTLRANVFNWNDVPCSYPHYYICEKRM